MTSTAVQIDRDALLRLIELADYTIPITIGGVANLGMADHLHDGPRSVGDLSAATGTDPRALHVALSALAAKGIFVELEPGRFALTPMAELLRSEHPQSMRRACLVLPADVEAWAELDHTIRTGEPAFDRVHGRSFWQYLADHRDESALFDANMQALTNLELLSVIDAYDWRGVGTLADVGGGNGAFVAGVLVRYAALRGVLYDLPHVVAGAKAVLDAAGVADRCDIIAGDFFDSVPAGAGVYVLKRILYSWDDERAKEILLSVRKSMRPDSRLVVIEPVRKRGGAFDVGKILDLQMLILGRGGVRDRRELRRLFDAAGLRLTHVIPTPMTAVIEARPAQ